MLNSIEKNKKKKTEIPDKTIYQREKGRARLGRSIWTGVSETEE